MISLTTQQAQAIHDILKTTQSNNAIIQMGIDALRDMLANALNNPKFAEPDADTAMPISGISVPPKIDEHGKQEPGCL